jgi:hypothetical protein
MRAMLDEHERTRRELGWFAMALRLGMLFITLVFLISIGMSSGPPFVPLKGHLIPWFEFGLMLGCAVSMVAAKYYPFLPILFFVAFEFVSLRQVFQSVGLTKGWFVFSGSGFALAFMVLAAANWVLIRKSESANRAD